MSNDKIICPVCKKEFEFYPKDSECLATMGYGGRVLILRLLKCGDCCKDEQIIRRISTIRENLFMFESNIYGIFSKGDKNHLMNAIVGIRDNYGFPLGLRQNLNSEERELFEIWILKNKTDLEEKLKQ